MSKHTKEPWKAFNDYAILTSPTTIAFFDDPAERDLAMKCVNALAGLNPDAVGEVVEAAALLLADIRRRYPGQPFRCPYICAIDAALAKLRTAGEGE